MTAPLDNSWDGQFVNGSNLDKTTYGQGTSFPSSWSIDRIFWRTDKNTMYKNSGTEGTPVWSPVGGLRSESVWPTTFTLNDRLFLESTNRYYQVVNTSPIICKSSDDNQMIAYQNDTFTGYADTIEGDAAYPTNSTARIRVNPTNDVLDVNTPIGISTPSRLYRDLSGTLSDKYVARFKMDVKTVTQGSTAHQNYIFMGFSAETADVDNSNSFVGLAAKVNSQFKQYWAVDDESSPISLTGQFFTHAVAVEVLYVEIKVDHIANTYDVNLYSDSNYSTLVEGKTGQTLSSTHPKPKYFIIHVDGSNASGDHQITVEIDDLIIADGVSSIS